MFPQMKKKQLELHILNLDFAELSLLNFQIFLSQKEVRAHVTGLTLPWLCSWQAMENAAPLPRLLKEWGPSDRETLAILLSLLSVCYTKLNPEIMLISTKNWNLRKENLSKWKILERGPQGVVKINNSISACTSEPAVITVTLLLWVIDSLLRWRPCGKTPGRKLITTLQSHQFHHPCCECNIWGNWVVCHKWEF